MNLASKANISRFIGLTVAALTCIFFVRTLNKNWEKVDGIDLSLSFQNILAYLTFVSAIVVSGILWGAVFNRTTQIQTKMTQSIQAHSGSWLMKYIPGQIGSLVFKMRWGTNLGATKKSVALAFGYENFFLTLASVIPTVPIILLGSDIENKLIYFILYLALLISMYLFTRNNTNKLITKFIQKVTKQTIDPKKLLKGKTILYLTIYFLSARFINGLAFVLLTKSVTQVSAANYLYLAASYIFAGIVGIYAIFVPSGLGVREGVLVLLTTSIFGLELAIALSILARLYTTLSDVAVGLIYLTLKKVNKGIP